MDLNSLKNMASQAGLGQQPGAAGGPSAPKSPKKLIIIIVAAVVGVSVLGAVGNFIMGKAVSFGTRKAIEVGTGLKIDEKGDKFTVTGKDGTQMQFSGDEGGGTVTFKDDKGQTGVIESQSGEDIKTLPKDFPKDFPLLSGAALTGTYSMSLPEQGTSYSLVWTTDRSPEDVAAYFERELAAQGWKKNFSASQDETTVLQFERAAASAEAKDTAIVSVEKKDAVTEFSLSLMLAPR